MYCFLVFALVACMCICGLVLALRSWVDVELPEKHQYQYPEQPPSDQFEQQQEQYEEGKYNMNNLSLLITISYCILILYAYKDFLATLYPLYIPLGCILVSCARLLRYNTLWSFLINLINGLLELNSESGPLCGWVAHVSLKDVFVETWFRGPARCLVLGWPLSIRTGS